MTTLHHLIRASSVFQLVYDFPEDAKFLSHREREIVINRLKFDQGSIGTDAFRKAQMKAAVKDWKVCT